MNAAPFRDLATTVLLSSLPFTAPQLAAQTPTPAPPALRLEFETPWGWSETMPAEAFIAVRILTETADGDCTATWWDLMGYGHIVAGSQSATEAAPDVVPLVDQVAQPYQTLVELGLPLEYTSSTSALVPWSLPTAWPGQYALNVFTPPAGGSGDSAHRMCVPTYRSSTPTQSGSVFGPTVWWDQWKKDFFSDIVFVRNGKVMVNPLAWIESSIQLGGIPLGDEGFPESDYSPIYWDLALRVQPIGFRDRFANLATYPMSPTEPPTPSSTPPPQLPSGPSPFRITTGTYKTWVTAGVRKAFGRRDQPPPNYTVRPNLPVQLRYSGFVAGTQLFVRTIDAGPIVTAQLPAMRARPGVLQLVATALPPGRVFEIYRVEDPGYASDLIDGERALLTVMP